MIGGVAYSIKYLLSLFEIKLFESSLPPFILKMSRSHEPRETFLDIVQRNFHCSSILNKTCERLEPYVGRFRQTASWFVIRDEIFRILGIRHKYDGPLVVSEIDKWKQSVVESHQTITEVNKINYSILKNQKFRAGCIFETSTASEESWI